MYKRIVVAFFFLIFIFLFFYFRFWLVIEFYQKIVFKNPSGSFLKIYNEYFVNDISKFSGIFLRSDELFVDGLWVWGKTGMKLIRLNEDVVFSEYVSCGDDGYPDLTKDGKIDLKRKVHLGYERNKPLLTPGGYVFIKKFYSEKQGGVMGYAQELYVYDWQPYLLRSNTICNDK